MKPDQVQYKPEQEEIATSDASLGQLYNYLQERKKRMYELYLKARMDQDAVLKTINLMSDPPSIPESPWDTSANRIEQAIPGK